MPGCKGLAVHELSFMRTMTLRFDLLHKLADIRIEVSDDCGVILFSDRPIFITVHTVRGDRRSRFRFFRCVPPTSLQGREEPTRGGEAGGA